MPKKPVAFGGRTFASKGDFQSYLQSIWDGTEHYIPLLPEDEAVILDLLSNHPEEPLKVGEGVDYIFVAPSPKGGRCFHVKRIDGTSTDFGTKNCLDGRPQIRKFKAACRYAVQDQIAEAKRVFFSSSEGREMKQKGVRPHADHISPTFDCLIGKFILKREIDLNTVEFEGVGVDNSCDIAFKSGDLATAFAQFHLRHARLEFVTAKENLERKRGAKKVFLDSDNFVYVKLEDREKEYEDGE